NTQFYLTLNSLELFAYSGELSSLLKKSNLTDYVIVTSVSKYEDNGTISGQAQSTAVFIKINGKWYVRSFFTPYWNTNQHCLVAITKFLCNGIELNVTGGLVYVSFVNYYQNNIEYSWEVDTNDIINYTPKSSGDSFYFYNIKAMIAN
ncbi:MAG: hypothetical protein K6E51_13955, partial [Treponema sp.]|nr:hypothetical protein [Treponema sp.]